MMSIFKDKVAIVTGGAGGIGKGLCEELCKHDAIVIATDINDNKLKKTVKKICDTYGRCSAVTFSSTDYDAFKKCIEDTAAREGRLDYIFNN